MSLLSGQLRTPLRRPPMRAWPAYRMRDGRGSLRVYPAVLVSMCVVVPSARGRGHTEVEDQGDVATATGVSLCSSLRWARG